MAAFENDLNSYPRHIVHLVKELNRHGYGVWLHDGEKEMSANDIKGLANVLTTEVGKLQDRARKAGDGVRQVAQEAHEVITHVEQSTAMASKAIAELRAALGQTTNNPPGDEQPNKK